MVLLDPLGLTLFGLAAPLLALYFIKVRRRDHEVPSLMLWESEPRERAATALFQRLQLDPLIVLQLLVLLALALALSRPALTVPGEPDRTLVVVLDTSASMKATDVRPSRFDEARSRAGDLVRALPPGARVMILEAGIQPRVTAEMGTDRSRALEAIERSRAHDVPNRLADALRIARALIGEDPRAEIHVFTDGALAEVPDADARIRWVGVGRSDNNVAITQLSARRTYQGPSSYQAFLALENFSSRQQTFGFLVKVDGRTIAERQLTLAPHIHRSLVLPFTHSGAGRIVAELKVDDDLAVDNVAYAILPEPTRIAVTLVTTGNRFLEKALRSDPDVALRVLSPGEYAGGMGEADVVVLDSVTPKAVGAGRFILVNTVPPDVPVEILGTVEKPNVMDWDRSHPVMRYVDFSRVAIESALRLRPLAPGRALVEAELGGPLVYALEEPGRKAVLVGFDLFKADLALRVAFPMILSNSLRWLHPGGREHSSVQLAAGQPLHAPVAHDVDAVAVRTPSGRIAQARIGRGSSSFSDTTEIGVYTLSSKRGDTQVAVNLTDKDESDIAPRPLPRATADAPGMSVPVEREIWPALVACAVVLLILEGLFYWRRQGAGRLRLPRATRDRAALALRGCLVAILCAVFFKPALPQTLDRMNVVFLLDQSDSVSRAARERASGFVEQAVRAAKPGDRHAVIAFGSDAAIRRPLSEHSPPDLPARTVDGRGTNIYQAIELALAMLPSAEANRLVLLSDGRQNAGNALAGAQAVRDAGADLHYVAAPLTSQQEVVAEDLQLPREVKFGEPFQLRVVAWSQNAASGRVVLYRNGQLVGSQKVEIAAGKNVFSYRQALDQEGIQVYQAALEVDGDTIEENNRAVGTVLVHGRPKVLLADRDRNHAQSLAAALRAQQLEVTLADPEEIPRDMNALQKYDGVVLSNVSAIQLDRARMTLIRDYVRDQGGGLIMIGGDHSFGLGGYYQTPIEEALPVTMEVKQRVDVPNLSIVLSIDRSDSMTTIASGKVTYLDLAKEAGHLVVDLVDENSEVGVMSWDTAWKWEVPLRPARNKAEIHHGIASIASGGGTDGFPALREAYQALARRPAVLKHVIFLTDGQMRREPFQELVERMAKDRITVSTVAVGKWSDEKLLRDIARWGKGRFYKTEDSQSLPRIFAVETQLASSSAVVEQPFRPRLTDPSHDAIQDIDWKNAPALNGYVATTAKASAEQVLVSHWDDPVLATWRYGLGRAAAFTSDANPRWAQNWLKWGEFNRFWAQLVRWTLRSASTDTTSASVERRDGNGEVVVDAVDAKGAFVNFLDAQIGVVAPDRARSVIDLEQVGPGRYRGIFPARQQGVYLVGMAKRMEQRELGSEVAGLVVPYASELRELGVDRGQLNEMAELAGGAELTDPRDAFLKERRPFRQWVDAWPWLVELAALWLLIEIALRRFGSGFARRH